MKVVIRTKIGNGCTSVATYPCDSESKAKEIANASTEAFRECRKLLDQDPDTVSTTYELIS